MRTRYEHNNKERKHYNNKQPNKIDEQTWKKHYATRTH